MSNPFSVAQKYLEQGDQNPAPADRTEAAMAAPACFVCGRAMTKTRDVSGKSWWACEGCPKTIHSEKAIDDGPIIAVLIDSEVLGAPIWFALNDDWKPDPGDITPVFYASELPFLRTKSPETLREVFKVKIAFGGGMVRQ